MHAKSYDNTSGSSLAEKRGGVMKIHGKDGCSVAARRNTCSIVSIDVSAQSSALINLGRF